MLTIKPEFITYSFRFPMPSGVLPPSRIQKGEPTLGNMYEANPGHILDRNYNITLNGKPVEYVAYARPGDTDGVVGLHEVDYAESRKRGVQCFVLTTNGQVNVVECKGTVTVEAKVIEDIEPGMPECINSTQLGPLTINSYNIARSLTLNYRGTCPAKDVPLYEIITNDNFVWNGLWNVDTCQTMTTPGTERLMLKLHSQPGSSICDVAYLHIEEPSFSWGPGMDLLVANLVFVAGSTKGNGVGTRDLQAIKTILEVVIPKP